MEQTGGSRLVHDGLRLGTAEVTVLIVAWLGLVLAAAGAFCLVRGAEGTLTEGVRRTSPLESKSQGRRTQNRAKAPTPKTGFSGILRHPNHSTVQELRGLSTNLPDVPRLLRR